MSLSLRLWISTRAADYWPGMDRFLDDDLDAMCRLAGGPCLEWDIDASEGSYSRWAVLDGRQGS